MINKRVRMLQTRSGFHSQNSPFSYKAGDSYWMPLGLANQYIEKGIAMEDKAMDVPETKVKKRKRKILNIK